MPFGNMNTNSKIQTVNMEKIKCMKYEQGALK